MRIILLILLLQLLWSCNDLDEHLNVYPYFTFSTIDIAHFKYIRTIDRVVEGRKCHPVKEYKVIKVFHGELKPSQKVIFVSPGEGHEIIAFIGQDYIEDYRKPNECTKDRVKSYKSSRMSYEIRETKSKKQVVFYEELSSETFGPEVLIDLEDVYEKLDDLAELHKNSN